MALGDGAVADRIARSQNGIVINTSDPSKSTGFNTENSVYAPVRLVDAPEALNLIKNTIKGNKGAVSVGDSGNTRQIINVAAGSADSDAVNVAQLKAVAGAIKHYDVTSPNGDITVTHPNPEDPNKTVWNLNLNPDRVKEITKWKLRDVEENGNPEAGKTDALVKGDETVTFQDTDTINVERDGKTLQFRTKKNIKYFSVNSSGGTNEDNKGATGGNAIAIGKDASSTGSNAVSLGLGANASGANNTAIGPGAQAKDVRTTAIGYNAKAEAASAVGIGYEANATHSRSLAIGQDATASANNAIALGSSGQQSGNDRPNKTTASAEHAVAIGSGAEANIANGIALGSESKTTATSASGQSGFDASQEAEGVRKNKYNELTGKNLTSNLAGLSIGNDGKTRQINHLAAGKADDDAVNVAQLKSVNLAFKGDNNTKGDVRLHDQRLSIVGATNDFITTKANDNKLEIGTKQGTFSTTNGKSSSPKQGLATTTAVANTINQTYWQLQADGSQVGDVNPGDKVNIASGNGITVTPTTEANGVSKITINATVAGIKAGHNVTVETTNGVSTINAIDTNTQASVSKATNSPITINATGADNAKNYELDVNVDKTTITKTGGVLKAVTGNLNVNSNGNLDTPQTGSALVNATTLTNVVNNTYWKAAAGGNHADGKTNLPADKVKSSSTVTFNAGKNLTVDHSVANNFTFALNNTVDLTDKGSLTIGNTKVDNGGITITPAAGKSPVTLTANGLDNGNNKIVNVANGTNPTDAVNKSQLDDSISTESVVKADAEAGDKNIATITVADSKNTGDKGAKYQVGVSEKAVKEAARNAIDVTGTNFISATSNVAGDVETHTVTATTNAVTMTTEGKANTPTATGLTTNKDVADAINASGWKISEGDTSKGIVNPGNEVSFKGGEGTEVTVSDADGNGKRTVTIASTVKPNQIGTIEEVTANSTGENAPKKGQVQAKSGDGDKVTKVSNVADMINSAKWFAKADNSEEDLAETKNDDGKAVNAGSELTFKAGKNLHVNRTNGVFTFALNNDINLTNAGSLTIGETKVDNGGITITPAAGKSPVTLTANGLDNGNNKIVNVANGTNPTDAVNKSQLDDSISTESVVKADAEAGDKNIATITVADSKNTGDKGAKYQVGVSEKAVKEAARNAINVTGTNFISATSKVEGDVETHTVEATTNAVTMNTAEGKANTPTATGLTTNKDVADAINASGWKISEGSTSKGIVNPGNEVSFEGGEGTTVTVSDATNGKRTVTIASTVKPNEKGVIEEVTANSTDENAPKKGQVQAKSGDGDKVTKVSNVADMINKAKWFAKAENSKDEVTDKTDDSNSDGQAMSAGDKLTLKAGKNLSVNRTNGVFTFALNNTVDLTKDGSLTIGETKVDNGGITITPAAGKSPVTLTANGLDNGGNKIVNVAAGEDDNDAVNVAQLKSTERHITPTTYTYNDTDKSVTLTYTDGNGNLVKDTNAKIDLSGLERKIKDYSFKTNATGSNLVETGTETTVASGKSVNFAASDNLTLKQDVKDGNVTYTYGLKNQVVVGEKGTPGKDGIDGSIGVNGENGSAVAINGKDGSIGLNGKNGENGLTIKGAQGPSGVDGKDGKDGKESATMTRIVYETPKDAGSTETIKHEVATLDDGQKYAGDNYVAAKDNQVESNVIAKKANERLDIVGGAKGNLTEGNIGVNAKDGKLHVQLAEKVNLGDKGSVTIGDTVVNNNGITINSPADLNGVTNKTVSLTNQGLNNGGNKITNVAEGENDTDAVNVKQLKTFKDEVGGYGWNLSVNNGEKPSKITKDTTVDLNNDDGNIKIAKNGSNVTLSLGPDVGLGKAGKDGKDGSLSVRGKNGASVEISGKDGSIGLTGPKGKDGTPGASATITVEKGTTTVNDGSDGDNKVNRIVYTDKDKNGKDIKREVATLDDGLKFKGDSEKVINRTLGSQMNITGGADENKLTDKNIGVVYDKDTNGLKVKLSKDVNLGDNGTITIGDTVVNKDGLTINGGPSVTKGGVNAGNQSVTNVKDGVTDNDAVNVKQLKAAKTEVEAGDHIDVTSRTGANGQTIYKVSAKGINDTSAAVKGGSDHVKVTKANNTHKDGSTTVTDYTVDLSDKTKEDIKKGVDAHTEVTTKGLTFNADKGSTGVKKLGSKVSVNGDGKNITTTADENGVKVSMKDDIKVNSVTAKEVKVGDVNINENGINAGGKRITNVAPGKDGTDAVNVNQLKYVAGNISNQINNVDKGLRAGIAGALASGGLYHVTTAGKSMVSVGAGTYRGQNALAVGYSRLSDNGKVGVKFTVNSNSQGHAGASASVGYQW